jgi:hypothetical protein
MMGHKLLGARNSYSRPSDQQWREAYANAYPHFRLLPIPAATEEMRKQAEKLKKAKTEVQESRARMQKNVKRCSTSSATVQRAHESRKKSPQTFIRIT